MVLNEYLTKTYIDTHHPCLPLYHYLYYSPKSHVYDLAKPLILLLHGAGGDHHQFDNVFPSLIQNDYPVMVCDLRYHGKSQPTIRHDVVKQPDLNFNVMIEDLDRALLWFSKQTDESKKVSVVLGGISMGGMLAQHYILRLLSSNHRKHRKIKVHALVGIGCASIQISDPLIPWMTLYRHASYNDEQIKALMAAAGKNIVDSSTSDLGKLYAQFSLSLVNDRVLFYCLHACAHATVDAANADLFRLPQLLLRGELDCHTSDVMATWYTTAIQFSVLVDYKVIPEADHLVTLDAGAQVAKHIVPFLSSSSPSLL